MGSETAVQTRRAAAAYKHALGVRGLAMFLAAATAAAAPMAAYREWLPHPWFGSLAVSGALGAAAVCPPRWRVAARSLATLGALGWSIASLAAQPHAPARGLIVMLGCLGFIAYLWPSPALLVLDDERPRDDTRLEDIVFACCAALLIGMDAWSTVPAPDTLASVALSAMCALPVLRLWPRCPPRGWLDGALFGLAALSAGAPAATAVAHYWGAALPISPLGLLSPTALLLLMAYRTAGHWFDPNEPGLLDAIVRRPARVLVVSFAFLCAAGTVLLSLPVASATGDALSVLNAGFTAVSATCVTGLIVVDTPTALTGFGEAVVLVLIQVGGLGIMALSAAALALLGRRLSLSQEATAVDLIGATGRADLTQALRAVLRVTVGTELVAAAMLTGAFMQQGDDWAHALWRGVFTAVSAFCNAGFALQTESLIPYADNPAVLSIVGITIVIGGLGPSVVVALLSRSGQGRHTLHARLVLWASAILVLGPALCIAILEWNASLAELSMFDKFSNALFQSITLRTAGFNSVDLGLITPSTWTLMVILMFVGGSPGSTAGGAKTTSVAVMGLAVAAVVRGRTSVEVFGRTLPAPTVLRALAVTTLGVLACFGGLAALQLTQTLSLDSAVFEVVSALATVGLSLGATGQLDDVGKLIIMGCMFAGRVGPLTLFVFLASNTQERSALRYPEEAVPIG